MAVAMESATLRRPPPLPTLVHVGLIALLLVLAVVAWAVTDERMQGMDAGPGTDLGEIGWFIGVWVVMMAAMMFPAIWPMVVTYARVESRQDAGAGAPAGAIALFVAGYLVVWSAVGLFAYAIFEIVRSADIGFLGWDEGGRYLAGGALIAAAGYQLTSAKDTCLEKCRDPLAFVMDSWRPGRLGALRMGIEHGGWCVGCCWALMVALFALGVMSIGWMALIAAMIAAEKLLPWKVIANRVIAIVLAGLGIAVLAAPEDVPGFTVPDSPEASQAMEAMGMEAEPEGSGTMGMEDEAERSGGMGGMEDEPEGSMQP